MSPPDKFEPKAGQKKTRDASGDAGMRAPSRLTLAAEIHGEEPWDPMAAETLTRIYESIADDLVPAVTREKTPAETMPSPSAAAPVSPPSRRRAPRAAAAPASAAVASGQEPPAYDRAWLEGRLTAIADRLETSFAHANPEKSIAALTNRLDRLEQRFDAAMKDVALRSDVAGLDEVAARTREIVDWFDQARGQLARLDTIEAQLRDVSRRLDDRLQHAPGVDASQIAAAIQAASVRSAVEPAPSRMMSAEPAASRMDALEDLLREHIDERRRSEELTSTVLAAIENTLAGIGERLETLDPRGLASTHRTPAHEVETDGPGVDGDALTEAYEKGARALGQRAGFALDAADYASLTAPRLLEEAVPGDRAFDLADPHGDRDAHEAIEAPPALEPFRASLLRARLQAQADSIRSAAEGEEETPPRTARMGVPRGSLVSLLLAVVLLFLAGYLTVDRLLDGRMPAPQPAGRSASGAETQSAGSSDSRARDHGGAAGAPATASPDGRTETVPFNAPLQRPQTPEPVTQEQGRTEPASGGALASVRTFGVAVSNWLQAKPQVVKASADVRGRDLQPAAGDSEHFAQTIAAIIEPPAAVGSSALRRAAATGDPAAQFEVGSRFAEGLSVPQDWQQAVTWYQRAATRGYAPAQFRLALLLERGLGVAADQARAKVWYRRAAEQGNVKAMHNLAVLSAAEAARGSSYAEAVKWFSEAAERGLADSQFNLAVLYELGRGVTKDYSAAYRWFALANRAGDKEAGRRLEAVRPRLLAPEVAAAEAAVLAWRPQTLDVAANGLQASAMSPPR